MRNLLEHLLRVTEVHDPANAELRWQEYREGAGSPDPERRASAEAAFRTLIAWYGRGIYRHIWGFVRTDVADDIFQDVLRKLHEHRNDNRLVSFKVNVLPWLRRVAIHQCLDTHREQQRRTSRETRAALPEKTEPHFVRSEWNEAIAHALENLPLDLQQVVALHYFEGLNGQESAAALGIHRDTFASRLKQALEQLRKQIHFPALIAGGFATIPAALSAAPPVTRLDHLIPDKSPVVAAAGTAKIATVIALAGLVFGGMATFGWFLLPGAPAGKPAPPPAAVPAPETFQERNIRMTRDEIVPKLLPLQNERLPEGKKLRLADVRAFGSAVECEFQTEAPLIPGWKPTKLKVYYCTAVRYLQIQADLKGQGDWKLVDPKRPIILDLAIPGIPIPALDLAKDLVDQSQHEFDRLADDPRADPERVRHLFGTGPDLIVPAGLRGFCADANQLYVVDVERGISVRDASGQWHAAGTCPGWWMVAHQGRLYCQLGPEILVRDAGDPKAPWTRWCESPELKAREDSGFLAVANHELYVTIQPGYHAIKPLDSPANAWRRVPTMHSTWPDGVAGSARDLFAHDPKLLFVRSALDDSATWKPIGTWPDGCSYLAVDGNRLLALGRPGSIYTRPIDAGPEVEWTVAGQVREPERK